MSDSTSGT
jgi:hypothetical protein